jgi:hypothetical protein
MLSPLVQASSAISSNGGKSPLVGAVLSGGSPEQRIELERYADCGPGLSGCATTPSVSSVHPTMTAVKCLSAPLTARSSRALPDTLILGKGAPLATAMTRRHPGAELVSAVERDMDGTYKQGQQ